MLSMLVNTAEQVIGYAGMECCMGAVGQDIDIVIHADTPFFQGKPPRGDGGNPVCVSVIIA